MTDLVWIVRFNVRTRRLEPFPIGVRDIFAAEKEQLSHDPELAYLLDPFRTTYKLAATHYVNSDGEVIPMTPEALAAGLYSEETPNDG